MARLNPIWLMTVATAFAAVSLGACGAGQDDLGASEADSVGKTEESVIATAVTSQQSVNFSVTRGATVTASATCPSGSRVVAGGYQTFNGLAGLRVIESRPNGNGWQIKVVHNSPNVNTINASVSAECLTGTKATALSPVVGSGITIGPGGTDCDIISCLNTDTDVLTGVGFVSSSAFELSDIFTGSDSRFFRVCGRNTNPNQSIRLQGVSNCVRGVTGGLRRQSTATQTIAPFTRLATTINSAACASGTPLSFGAIRPGDLGVLALDSQRSSNIWTTQVINTNSFKTTVFLSTYCLDLFQ